MLTQRTIHMPTAGRLLGVSLPSSATDAQFLETVFDLAQLDAKLHKDIATVADGDAHSRVVLRVARELVRVPARVAVSIHGPGTHLSVRPVLLPRTRKGALAYALALLLDDDLPYRRELRRCQLDGCGKFFLVYRPPLGRPRDRYCTPEHMQEKQDRGLSKRVMKSRAKQRKPK